MTESRGSVKVVRTTMTTGKVDVTSDATIETFKLGQVGTESQEMGERLKKQEDETKVF